MKVKMKKKKKICYHCGEEIKEKDLEYVRVREDPKTEVRVPMHKWCVREVMEVGW